MRIRKSKDESLLIIFYKNPELGKVKTRLAATIGDAKAYAIYLLLSEHTRSITEKLPMSKALYYSDFIDHNDSWHNEKYQKHLQMGGDLGEKMMNAFRDGFKNGYQSICIIGTDCLELTPQVVKEGFRKLHTHDIVVGPAHDGGYYLLGMNYLHPALFQNKSWSTNRVLAETLHDIKLLGLTYRQLDTLNDIDEEKDLPPHFRT
ncbi:TIGR04282 family arsenosugar biosynthesis glycosyltransferase [Chryseolinea sp. H1M3-3]|uniref:TIGR04282 family arsenosugar biosynthesis glycosyltransferase n=1 Tax=Chryseolinea sp. H1M3-3 TaxID=3034144 RepID=UPI0023EC8809|nr:TIGR04282 family arsenosugar biosynthesis glycosyltransferase [Chryseolinea sp. H1M3-3]